MRKNTGASLFQYMVVVTIVGLAVAVAYTVLGLTIRQQFSNMLINQEGMNEQINENMSVTSSGGPVTPGSLGGKIDAPASSCNAGNCVIDYGQFVLNGVPENFQEIVETTGVSGGTDSLASVIDQIADYLDSASQPKEATQLRNLANVGHFLSQIAEKGEQGASGCAGNTDPVACFQAFVSDPSNSPTLPDNLKSILTRYESVQVPGKAYETLIGLHGQYGTVGTRIDTARMWETTNPSLFDAVKDFNPAYQFVDIYDDINSNPNLTPEVKSITKELYKSIADITIEHQKTMSATYSQYTNMGSSEYDVFTGTNVTGSNYSMVPLDQIVHPQTSINTNVRSSLICATGEFDSDGTACK